MILPLAKQSGDTIQQEFLSNGAPRFFSKPRKINDDRFLDDLLPFAGNV